MLKLSLGLVHNKGNLGNRQQIQNLLPLVVAHWETLLDPDTGEPIVDPISGDPVQGIWYSLSNLTIEHKVSFYQVIPYGVNPPNNLNSLNSSKVFYGAGDNDKTGEHPRFHNWLLRRGTGEGADICLYIRFPTLFGLVDLETRLTLMANNDRLVLMEPTWGKMTALRCLSEVGRLAEDRPFDDAFTDLRQRIINRGLEWG